MPGYLNFQWVIALAMLGTGFTLIVLGMSIAGLGGKGIREAVDEIFDGSFGFTPPSGHRRDRPEGRTPRPDPDR
ncbi:hypothetical protein [uncultured Brevundimonas sp.]|uniref:hypothetical protein n=1 Tax=uncultured Brevundimonas sp. TaxID=213418 RepID=UPI0030EB6463|tara:strand:+ start:2975 stop:3196 length:222 start_codon:yes stop_codon:yes gene_type:complete